MGEQPRATIERDKHLVSPLAYRLAHGGKLRLDGLRPLEDFIGRLSFRGHLEPVGPARHLVVEPVDVALQSRDQRSERVRRGADRAFALADAGVDVGQRVVAKTRQVALLHAAQPFLDDLLDIAQLACERNPIIARRERRLHLAAQGIGARRRGDDVGKRDRWGGRRRGCRARRRSRDGWWSHRLRKC